MAFQHDLYAFQEEKNPLYSAVGYKLSLETNKVEILNILRDCIIHKQINHDVGRVFKHFEKMMLMILCASPGFGET
jgi:RNAse (barnase) inhibitor barstar